MDWKTIGNMDVYTNAERDRAQRDNIALSSPPLQPSDLPQEILARLQPHYSNWSLQNNSVNVRELRKSDSVMLFEKQGKDWVSVQSFTGTVVMGETAYAVSRRSLRKEPRGGGSGRGGDAGQATSSAANSEEPQLVPSVIITTPGNGSSIKLTDKKHITTSFKEYTFKNGDTVNSVVKNLTGQHNPSAILNYNPPFSEKRPPQEGDPVRVAVGQALVVKGGVTNTGRVNLSWKSEKGSIGSQSTSVQQGGKNQSVDWEIKIDKIKPGDYTLTAIAGSASHTSQFTIEPQHWLRLLYNDENDKPVDLDLDYEIRFEDGSRIRGRLKNGRDYIMGVPLSPFTIEFLPSDEKQKELDALYQQLDELLTSEVSKVTAQSAPLKKEWEQHPWYMKYIISDLYLKKGVVLWAWDTLKGLWTLVSGVVTGAAKTAAWVAEFQLHKEKLFYETVTGDQEGIKRESAHLKKMLTDVGDDVSEITDMGETLYYLAHDDRVGPRLQTFAEDYFSALSVPERHEFVSRYGIDIVLIFVGGSGAALLGVKNSGKISQLLSEMVELIKVLRYKLTGKRKDVDIEQRFKPDKIFDKKLDSSVKNDANELIKGNSKSKLRKKSAVSRGGVEELNIISKPYTNLRGNVNNFAGVKQINDETFVITDKKKYIEKVQSLYNENNNPLNTHTKKLIEEYVGDGSKKFPTQAGLPGLHAEVQSYNNIVNQVPNIERYDLSKIQISTYKVAPGPNQGSAFKACSNCGSIIPDSVNITTGRKY